MKASIKRLMAKIVKKMLKTETDPEVLDILNDVTKLLKGV